MLVIIGFLGTAVLGFLAVACLGLQCGHSDAHAVCLASKVNAATCPEEANVLAFINFHIYGFKDLSSGIVNSFALASALLLFSLLTLFFLKLNKTFLNVEAINLALYHRIKLSSELSSIHILRQAAKWLSLHENSPALT